MVDQREPKVTTDKVRAGSTPGVARYVLSISLVLIVLIFGILLIYYR